MSKKIKTEIIYICGVPFRVETGTAEEFKTREKERIREDWQKNRLVD